MNQEVAIIGGGISGILSAKYCLENNLTPVIFDKCSTIGGAWGKDGLTWDSLMTNNSKYFLNFMDYVWDDNFGDNSKIVSKHKLFDFLNDYINKFSLKDYFSLNCEILKIEKNNSGDEIYLIEYKDLINNIIKIHTYNYIIVSTGFFSNPYIPKFDSGGIQYIHSKEYNKLKNEEILNKNILIIGNNDSGVEISSDLCIKKCKKVYHLFRKPKWIIKKNIYSGKYNKILPQDLLRNSRTLSKEFTNEYFSNISEQNKLNNDLFIDLTTATKAGVQISDYYVDFVKNNMIIPIKGEL